MRDADYSEKLAGRYSRAEITRLLVLLLLASALRVVYLYLYSQQSIWSDLIVDSLYHLNWADSIAHGNIFGSDTYFRAPLYIYLLAICRALAPDSLLLPRALGAALGVVSILVTYLLARRAVPGKTGEYAGLAGGALQAIYASAVYFEAELLVDFLFTLLLQLTIYRLLIADEIRTTRSYILAGIALGLACLTRPTALALIPFLLLYLYRFGRRKRHATTAVKPNTRGALVVALVTALVIAPVTIRNYIVGGDVTLIASSGGINFFIGNNAESSPVSASLPEPYGANWTLTDMQGLAEQYEGHPLSPAEISASWTKRALGWIVHHPGEFIINYFEKLYLALGVERYSNNRSLSVVFHRNPILRYSPINTTVLLFLSLIGVVALARAGRGFSGLLAPSVAGLYLLILALFFINERFRLPAMILLFPSAGYGLVALVRYCLRIIRKQPEDSGDGSRLSLSAVGFASVIAVISLLPFGKPMEDGLGRSEYLQANGYLNSGQLDRAITAFTELLRIDPAYPRAALNLGVAYFLKSEADSARRYFELELERSPNNPEALVNLASLALAQGSYHEADSLTEMALRRNSYNLKAFRIRVRALQAEREFAVADSTLASGERNFGADVRYWYERMTYYLSLNPPDTTRALSALRKGVALDPEDMSPVENSSWSFSRGKRERNEVLRAAARIRYQLGYFAGITGQYDSAIYYSREAIRYDSSLSACYVNLALGYLSQGFPDSAQIVYQTALNRLRRDTTGSADIERLSRIMRGLR